MLPSMVDAGTEAGIWWQPERVYGVTMALARASGVVMQRPEAEVMSHMRIAVSAQ